MREGRPLVLDIESRDPEIADHARRVTELALRLAAAVGAGPSRLAALRVGGPLHDVGKLGLDRAILQKPGPLDERELAAIRRHPVLGAAMLQGRRSVCAALDCVLHHHERWDGGGYPHRLGGHEIPFVARILAIVDAYDAMTSDRPYRAALTPEAARAEVARCAGTQFDPALAEAFLSL